MSLKFQKIDDKQDYSKEYQLPIDELINEFQLTKEKQIDQQEWYDLLCILQRTNSCWRVKLGEVESLLVKIENDIEDNKKDNIVLEEFKVDIQQTNNRIQFEQMISLQLEQSIHNIKNQTLFYKKFNYDQQQALNRYSNKHSQISEHTNCIELCNYKLEIHFQLETLMQESVRATEYVQRETTFLRESLENFRDYHDEQKNEIQANIKVLQQIRNNTYQLKMQIKEQVRYLKELEQYKTDKINYVNRSIEVVGIIQILTILVEDFIYNYPEFERQQKKQSPDSELIYDHQINSIYQHKDKHQVIDQFYTFCGGNTLKSLLSRLLSKWKDMKDQEYRLASRFDLFNRKKNQMNMTLDRLTTRIHAFHSSLKQQECYEQYQLTQHPLQLVQISEDQAKNQLDKDKYNRLQQKTQQLIIYSYLFFQQNVTKWSMSISSIVKLFYNDSQSIHKNQLEIRMEYLQKLIQENTLYKDNKKKSLSLKHSISFFYESIFEDSLAESEISANTNRMFSVIKNDFLLYNFLPEEQFEEKIGMLTKIVKSQIASEDRKEQMELVLGFVNDSLLSMILQIKQQNLEEMESIWLVNFDAVRQLFQELSKSSLRLKKRLSLSSEQMGQVKAKFRREEVLDLLLEEEIKAQSRTKQRQVVMQKCKEYENYYGRTRSVDNPTWEQEEEQYLQRKWEFGREHKNFLVTSRKTSSNLLVKNYMKKGQRFAFLEEQMKEYNRLSKNFEVTLQSGEKKRNLEQQISQFHIQFGGSMGKKKSEQLLLKMRQSYSNFRSRQTRKKTLKGQLPMSQSQLSLDPVEEQHSARKMSQVQFRRSSQTTRNTSIIMLQ